MGHCGATLSRFLPTQEWSVGGMEGSGRIGRGNCGRIWHCAGDTGGFGNSAAAADNWRQCGQQQCQKSPPNHNPPVDHSCVGRNLFLRKQEFHPFAANGGVSVGIIHHSAAIIHSSLAIIHPSVAKIYLSIGKIGEQICNICEQICKNGEPILPKKA